jgi:ketosteroid isomerase-like protein
VLIFLKALLRKYPRLWFTVHEHISEQDRVCVVWSNEGSNSSGEAYENRGVTIVRFESGLIAGISDYFKDTSFTREH